MPLFSVEQFSDPAFGSIGVIEVHGQLKRKLVQNTLLLCKLLGPGTGGQPGSRLNTAKTPEVI